MENNVIIKADSRSRIAAMRNGFVLNDRRTATTIVIPAKEEDDEWRKITEAPLDEYEVHHNDGCPEDIASIMQLFSCFISKHLNGTVLDIGCGIGTKPPPYARNMKNLTYVGLDPIEGALERDYPFVCSRVEDLMPEFPPAFFNGFIFSTSLDHIRNIKLAASTVKQLATNEAYAVFWIGLHDPELVALQAGSGVFKRIFSPMRLLRGWVKALAWALFYFPRLFFALKSREQHIRKSLPLDQNHFHFFTLASARSAVEQNFGQIVEEIQLPASNSIFLAVKL